VACQHAASEAAAAQAASLAATGGQLAAAEGALRALRHELCNARADALAARAAAVSDLVARAAQDLEGQQSRLSASFSSVGGANAGPELSDGTAESSRTRAECGAASRGSRRDARPYQAGLLGLGLSRGTDVMPPGDQGLSGHEGGGDANLISVGQHHPRPDDVVELLSKACVSDEGWEALMHGVPSH
jgi:hypothetical protein